MPDAPLLSPAAEPPTPPPDLTGRVLGDYQLLRRLGMGGMGQVYLARQLSLKRDVALKLLRNDLTTNTTALKRFQAEAEAVARLNHPNIVHIHQIGEHDGLRYMVLEYVDGRNLRDYLARKGPPDLAVTLSVIRQVVLALQKAHELGIVHRDIKPENILITRKAEVKVADFGLSRFFAGDVQPTNLTQSGIALGTPLYMAPEQVQGQPTDHRTDIYSLGVTCYHLLSGEPPFRGATAFDVAIKHVQEQPRPLADLCPDLPPDLCGMVHRMMAKSPADRYQSARDILRDLAKIRDGIALAQPAAAAAPVALSLTASIPNGVHPSGTSANGSATLAATTPTPFPRPVQWRLWALVGVACLAATVAGVLVFSASHPPPESAQQPPPPTPASPGLADLRPPEKIVTTRERELLALVANRQTPPEKFLKGSIELGLLYIHSHRLDEAKDRFERLEKEPFSSPPKKLDKIDADLLATRYASMAGRLGQAVVLAYRDTATAAQASNELVLKVVSDPYPKNPKLDKADRGPVAVSNFLLRHPDLAEAVAEALNRNAATLSKPALGAQLDAFRTPPKGGKKD